jgi:hypothetical protein
MKPFTLGQAVYQLYHRPAAALRESRRAGGPIEQWRTARGRRAMEAAAATLPPPPPWPGPPLSLHLLTGRRFWYQSAFCLWSFARRAERKLAPVFYDDGTLTEALRATLARLWPHSVFVSQEQTRARLDQLLPTARFPFLRDRWLHYPNIRKLTDPHLGSEGWKLIVDSDLLFFHRPGFLLEWLEAPRVPLHAIDVQKSYGYSDPLLETLAGNRLHPLLNVGLCGLNSSELDWEWLEHTCRALIQAEGTSYYLEQALVAVLLAGRDCAIAPAADYVTLPDAAEAAACRAVMHHYVADSKPWYFRHNWRKVLPAPR